MKAKMDPISCATCAIGDLDPDKRPPAHDCPHAREAIALLTRLVARGDKALEGVVSALAVYALAAASGETNDESQRTADMLSAAVLAVAPELAQENCSGGIYAALTLEETLPARV